MEIPPTQNICCLPIEQLFLDCKLACCVDFKKKRKPGKILALAVPSACATGFSGTSRFLFPIQVIRYVSFCKACTADESGGLQGQTRQCQVTEFGALLAF